MKVLMLFSIIFLYACSNLPENIKNPPSLDIQLHQVLSNRAKYQNIPVRWGGMIIHVENKTDTTVLQVQFYPLNSYGRPEIYFPSFGRFLTSSKQFNDNTIYSEGTEITVTGSLQEVLEKQIDDQLIQLPVITMQNHHIWPGSQQVYSEYGYPYHQRCQPWKAKPGKTISDKRKKFCTPVTRAQERIGSRDGTF